MNFWPSTVLDSQLGTLLWVSQEDNGFGYKFRIMKIKFKFMFKILKEESFFKNHFNIFSFRTIQPQLKLPLDNTSKDTYTVLNIKTHSIHPIQLSISTNTLKIASHCFFINLINRIIFLHLNHSLILSQITTWICQI